MSQGTSVSLAHSAVPVKGINHITREYSSQILSFQPPPEGVHCPRASCQSAVGLPAPAAGFQLNLSQTDHFCEKSITKLPATHSFTRGFPAAANPALSVPALHFLWCCRSDWEQQRAQAEPYIWEMGNPAEKPGNGFIYFPTYQISHEHFKLVHIISVKMKKKPKTS